jgi:hypothetical protein
MGPHGKQPSRVSSIVVTGFTVLAMSFALATAGATRAEAHLVGFTCTYESGNNDLTSDGTVRVIICGVSACYNQGATNFVRICLHHHAGWTSDLDCEDQDGYTRQAAIQWGGPSSGAMHGSPWW